MTWCAPARTCAVDLMRARHRLSKFLLRREIPYPGPGRAWTGRHRDWLVGLRFADAASEIAFADMLHAIDALLARRERLEAALAELVPTSPWAGQVGRLRCLRGIDTLSAVGLCAEVGDFDRFAHPRFLSSYLGLVPSEDSSGERRRLGSITKAGSRHARRLLVEAAWHYRRRAHLGGAGTPAGRPGPGRGNLAWRAQRRLHGRWRRLEAERGKRATLTAVAVARELSTFAGSWGNELNPRQNRTGCRGGAGPRPPRTSGPRSGYGQPPPRAAAPDPRQRALGRINGRGVTSPQCQIDRRRAPARPRRTESHTHQPARPKRRDRFPALAP